MGPTCSPVDSLERSRYESVFICREVPSYVVYSGCERLASIEETAVLVGTEAGSDSNNRLSVILNKAYRTARQGEYDVAISMLIDPSVWSGLTMHDYAIWAHQIWHILALRATRR